MTDPIHERIQADIDANPVVLYMKGTPVFPQCGFSAQVVQVLSMVGVKFKAFDVLCSRRGTGHHVQGKHP
jgi:monothiol glutaredoxin